MQRHMLRRQILEESNNHERWLVSYADFMTLLFAFFVVMYAISSVNDGKYKVLSSSLMEVFNNRARMLEPIQIGEPVVSAADAADTGAGAGGEHGDVVMDELATRARSELSGLIEEGAARVSGNEHWLEVSLRSGVLFASASADLSGDADTVLAGLVEVLGGIDNPVTVEGYTDSVPIANRRFASNWDLSAARAAAVARRLEFLGMDAERLAAVGYGENHPVATNATPEGRARNRRVTLIVTRNASAQRGLNALSADRAAPVEMRWAEQGEAVPVADENAINAVRLDDGGILFTNEAVSEDAAAGEPAPE